MTDYEWAGIATFSSSSYNERKYSPYADDEWPGFPRHDYRIRVFCA